jgi:hypothetical protein
MAFISKGRSLAVVKEASYAAATPTFVDGDYVDYTTGDISTDIAKIERNVMRNSMLKLESVLGQETSSGSIAVELSGAVTGALNGDKLYENGIGKKIAQATATTATAGSTTSLVNVTSATGLAVGQTLKVEVTLGNFEFVQITAISTLAISVYPLLSGAPAATRIVQGMLTYILPKPNDAVSSLAIRENLKPQSGSPIDYEYLGVMIGDTKFDYPVGGIATATFSVAGGGFTVNASGTTPTLPCSLLTPIIGKNAAVKVGATSYTAQDVSLTVATEITDIQAITTDGLTNKLAVGKTVTGSFKVEYTSITNFSTFKAGTKAALTMFMKDGGVTSPVIHGVIAPNIKFTNVTRSEDGMVIYDTIEYEVLSPDCGSVERGLSVFFVS